MAYNDDAREPSSVTGRALGTAALVGVLGGSGVLGYHGLKKVGSLGKKVGKEALKSGKKAGKEILQNSKEAFTSAKETLSKGSVKDVADDIVNGGTKVKDVAKEASILQVTPKNVAPNQDPNVVLKNVADEVAQNSKNRTVGNGTESIVSNAIIDKEISSVDNILESTGEWQQSPILKSAPNMETIKNPDMSKVTKSFSGVEKPSVEEIRQTASRLHGTGLPNVDDMTTPKNINWGNVDVSTKNPKPSGNPKPKPKGSQRPK